MDVVWLRHLAYVLMPALTVLWGESLRARFLHRGARRAIRLLLAALLAWQSVRLLKYMAEPAVLDADETLLRLLWYLYYIFRAPCLSHCSGLRMWPTVMLSRRGFRCIFSHCSS